MAMNSSQARGKRAAFVVGNIAYVHANTLRNAVNDATEIGKALHKLRFRVFGGTADGAPDTLAGCNLDCATTWSRYKQFLDAVEPGGTALIYYAGHGLQIDDQNYLVPVDARIDGPNPLMQLVPLRTLIQQAAAKAGPKGTTILLLDACREDPFSPQEIRKLSQNARTLRATLTDAAPREEHNFANVLEGFSTFKLRAGEQASKMFIAFATAPGELAHDGKSDHSPFAEAILNHVSTRGLPLDDFFGRVGTDVQERMAKEGFAQDPWHETNLKTPFYFRPVTLRPVWELAALSLVAGFVVCLGLFDAQGRVEGALWAPLLWIGALLYAGVQVFGTLRWGSGSNGHALFAALTSLVAFALGISVLRLSGLAWKAAQACGPATADINVGAGQIVNSIVTQPLLTGIIVVASLGGLVFSIGSALGLQPQGSIFRGFGTVTGAAVVGLGAGVAFLAWIIIGDYLESQGWDKTVLWRNLMIALGTAWFTVLGASFGYCFAYYVKRHRRIA